jgi:hypothetical protein
MKEAVCTVSQAAFVYFGRIKQSISELLKSRCGTERGSVHSLQMNCVAGGPGRTRTYNQQIMSLLL